MQRKRYLSALTAGLIMGWSAVACAGASTPVDKVTGGRHLADGTSYVSLLRLEHQPDHKADGTLLLAFEQAGFVGIPIYRSRDEGRHWSPVTHVGDQVHHDHTHWQLRWQPHLTELHRRSGTLSAGTLLLAANATHSGAAGVDREALQVYTSTDQGRTWHYRSTIVRGGGSPRAGDNNGVWEADIHELANGNLVAYYSSEQHKAQGYNQVLAHKVSTDGGRTWGREVIDVAQPGGVERPGMATVAHLPDGRYAMTYEDIDGPHNGQVYMKFSRDGLHWGDPTDRGTPVQTQGGAWPAACPVVQWFPQGGPHGVLVVSAERAGGHGNAEGHALYWNKDLGRGPWWEVPAPVAKRTGNIHAGWTQGLLFRPDGTLLQVTSSSSPAHPHRVADNEILYAAAPVHFDRYEAEDGARTGAVVIDDPHASNGHFVRIAAAPHGRLRFDIHVARAGRYRLRMRFAGPYVDARPAISINGAQLAAAGTVSADTRDRWSILQRSVTLLAGDNRVVLSGQRHVVDVDDLQLDRTGTAEKSR